MTFYTNFMKRLTVQASDFIYVFASDGVNQTGSETAD